MDDGALNTSRTVPASDVAEVRAKLFMHGGSQAVRLPKAFRFEGGEVAVRREGAAVILEPVVGRGPLTTGEIEAFYARMDRIRGDHEIVTPPRDNSPWRDPSAW